MRADVALTRCPRCGAPPRTPCRTPAREPLSHPHVARTTAYGARELPDVPDTARAVPHLVQQARRAAGLAQWQLAERAGLTQSTVSKIESGDLPLRYASLAAVAAALGCDVETLTGRENADA